MSESHSRPSPENRKPHASLTPYVIQDTGRGERSMDVFSRLLQDRIIFIGTEIDDHVANVVIAQLLILRMEDSKKDIHMYINSPGGVITSGLAIYDTMLYVGCDINTYCIGMAASMGALLLTAGTKGKRFALPNSRMMIHQPHGGVTGRTVDVERQANEIITLKKKLNKILSDATGQTEEKIREDAEWDYYMGAQEGVDYGLIDEVLYPNKQPKEASGAR